MYPELKTFVWNSTLDLDIHSDNLKIWWCSLKFSVIPVSYNLYGLFIIKVELLKLE